MAGSKNQDIIELVIKGEDEYSDVSEDVRQELERLSDEAKSTAEEFDNLQQSLDLSETYREQEADIDRLATAQAKSKQAVDALAKANKEAKGANTEIAASLAKAKAEYASLRTETNRAQKAFDQTKNTMRRYGVEIDQVENNQESMRASAVELTEKIERLSQAQDGLIETARRQVQATKDQAEAQKERARAEEQAYREEEQREAERQKLVLARYKAEVDAYKEKEQREAAQKKQRLALYKAEAEAYREAERRSQAQQRQVQEQIDAQERAEAQALAKKESAQKQIKALVQKQIDDQKRLEQATQEYRLELDKLINEYQHRKLSADQFEKSEARLRTQLKLTEQQVIETRQELKAYSSQISQVPAQTDFLTSATTRLAKAYGVLLAAQQAVAAVSNTTTAYTDTEDSMLGLQKTTNLTATELKALSEEMKNLSQDATPTTRAGLLEIASAAGRMGVEGVDNIAAFTKSIDSLSYAAELAGDETAQSVAQILNVTGEAQSNVTGVASAIAALGNSTATTEAEILKFSNRLASDTATVKLTSAEVLGLSASMSEMGLQAEGASTVVGRTFRYIEDAVKGGGKPMEDLQRITGQTSEELEKAFGDNKVQLFSNFVQGLSRIQDGGVTLNTILDDMGIKSDENARILGLLSQRYEGVARAVNISNTAFEAGNAHFAEASKQAAALSNGFQRLQNRIENIQSAMGEAFADDIVRVMDETSGSADDLEEQFADVAETLADVIDIVTTMTSAYSGLVEMVDQARGGLGLLDVAIATMGSLIEVTATQINLVVAGISKLAQVTNEFFGDTEDAERWAEIHEDAMQRVSDSAERTRRRFNTLIGDSSRAFDDLKDTYNANKDALSEMDEEQRKAVQTIIESTGYLEGNDSVYRDLTRSIQRAAAEKKVLSGLTDKENAQINASIALLRAQGLSQEEATAKAIAAAEAKKKAAEEAADLSDVIVDLTKKTEQAASSAAKVPKELSKALKTLKVDLGDTFGGLPDLEQEALSAFNTVADKISETGSTAEQASAAISSAFVNAFNQIETSAGQQKLMAALQEQVTAGKVSAEDYNKALAAVGTGADAAAAKVKNLSDTAEEAGGKILLIGDASEDTAEKTESSMDRAGRAAESMGRFYDGVTAELKGLSDAAFNYFLRLQGAAQAPTDDIEAMRDQVAQLGDEISGLRSAASYGFTGITDWMTDVAGDSALAKKAFYEQKIAVEQLTAAYASGRRVSYDLGSSVEDLSRRFDLLDEQDLSELSSTISRVKSQVDSLKGSLENTVSSLRQELAGLQGDNAEVERLRYEEQRAELQEQLQQARKLGDEDTVAAAQEALSLQRQAYDLKVQQTRQATEEANRQAAADAAEEERLQQEAEADQREESQQAFETEARQAQQVQAPQASTRTIILQSNNASAAVSVDESQEDDLLSVLEDLGYRSTGQ